MNVLSPCLPASPPGRFPPFFDYRRGEPVVLNPNPGFRADETMNAASEDKRASGIAESRLLIRLAKRSAPRSLFAATRRTRTGIEDGSGDRNIKSARPYGNPMSIA